MEESYPAIFMDFSQNSSVVIAFTVSHPWKPKKRQFTVHRKQAKHSANRRDNISAGLTSMRVDHQTDSNIVTAMKIRSIAE